jgi:polyisoprenyl-teichoic acid--peptidoglycan teichoic acid transferase
VRWRPIGFGVLACFLLVVMATAAYGWSALTVMAPRTDLTDLLAVATGGHNDTALSRKLQSNQPLTILLLGYGGPGDGGPYLTDSLLLISIQPSSRQAVMVAIPRDLVVPIPALPEGGTIPARINLAYAIGTDRQSFPNVRTSWQSPTGGGDLAAATVAELTGRPVDYWVAVDFKAFRSVVDALGGIQITIPKPLDDPYFPAEGTTGYIRVHFDAGPQRLNGERALEYARSRRTTSDSDRSQRQQLLLMTIRQQMGSLGLPQLLGLVPALRDNVRTNLRPGELRQLARLFTGIPQANIRQIGLDDGKLLVERDLPDGTFVLSPRGGDIAALQRYLASALFPPGSSGS